MAPRDAARAASLRHVTDVRDGITRRRAGKGFSYRDPAGTRIADRDTLTRIRALAIPPAWADVWICPSATGHLQATGRDARGRKQYRYHADWNRVRGETKYERMVAFGAALPRIRRTVDAHLALRGIPRERVLAVVVRLLETTLIRVGNEEYARTNKSFGLTTLLDRHADVRGGRLRLAFKGKSGVRHTVEVNDLRLAGLVVKCRELPGQDLFQFIDDDGAPQPITSTDVNEYLRDVAGDDFTAKDFRTWAGTLLAARHLTEIDAPSKPRLIEAVATVAGKLGNTPSVCRRCYIHPAVLDAYEEPQALKRWYDAQSGRAPRGLQAEESALLRYLAASPDK
ncbi:MAG: DNA topoisomerase IB [Gemmatimonadales bacterium]|nr:DNA topoisomerase IB [Gemmatimonadales bacterium]